jgi:undecaprenyl-diphosphatase
MQVALHPHLAGLSFVSGHAIITFAIAGLLALVLPRRWAVVAFVLATLNAVARVYLGAHNPLDVVGGAAIGLAIVAGLISSWMWPAIVGAVGAGRPPRQRRSGPPEAGRELSARHATAAEGPLIDAVLDCLHPNGKS